ncbi:MAG: ABC transporter substrate-binding protein [Actinomycetota bacterium]
MNRSTGWLRILAVLLAFGLIAAACGGDSDDGGDDGGDTDSGEVDEATTEEDGEDSAPATTISSGEDDRETESGPVRGGTLVYGIEADSANPWVHYATSCAISCYAILDAVADTLFVTDAEGNAVPYMAESAEASEDFMTWTITAREGITFHDGTPFDGAAIKDNIDACRTAPLTAPGLFFIADVQAEGQTATITTSLPYVALPEAFADQQCGHMFSPTWMRSLASFPLLTEEEAAAASGDQSAPVGAGPFVFESFTPGNGNSFRAVRNEDYWRGDGPNSVTGEGLPYLDAVEYVVAVDIQGRSSGLRAGQFDIMHTANSDEIVRFQDDDEFLTLIANDFGETSYILLNVAQGDNPTLAAQAGIDALPMDPGGLNAANPLIHETCRRALAHAIDRERVSLERNAGLAPPANGPFSPAQVGHLDDTGYPDYDPDAALAEMELCLADNGTDTIEFTFNTTNDAFNVETNTLIASMWSEVFGGTVNATIAPIEQGQYIGLALAGVFQAQGWRNHGGVAPVNQWIWWSSNTASPIDPENGSLALNFGRFQDPEIDAAIFTLWTNPDPAAQQEAAETINREFGTHVYNWWTTWTVWGVIANPNLQNLTEHPLPDGDGTTLPVLSGRHQIAQVWCTDGNCQG